MFSFYERRENPSFLQKALEEKENFTKILEYCLQIYSLKYRENLIWSENL